MRIRKSQKALMTFIGGPLDGRTRGIDDVKIAEERGSVFAYVLGMPSSVAHRYYSSLDCEETGAVIYEDESTTKRCRYDLVYKTLVSDNEDPSTERERLVYAYNPNT